MLQVAETDCACLPGRVQATAGQAAQEARGSAAAAARLHEEVRDLESRLAAMAAAGGSAVAAGGSARSLSAMTLPASHTGEIGSQV